jgi:hypothetical protein
MFSTKGNGMIPSNGNAFETDEKDGCNILNKLQRKKQNSYPN